MGPGQDSVESDYNFIRRAYISRLPNRIFKQKRVSKSRSSVTKVINNRRNEEIGFRAAFIPPNVNTRPSGARGQIDLR